MKKNISKILHTPFEKEDAYHSLSMPVYNTAAFEFDTAQAMEDAFCGRTPDFSYSRVTNPTVEYFERRVQNVTGAISVTALNCGMAAVSNTMMSLACAGGNIVTSLHLFGNTWSFFQHTLEAFGVEVRFCDLTNLDDVRAHIDEHTCAVFLEIITNPQMEVGDLSALSEIAHAAGVPLVADSTIVPFTVFKAPKLGVDIEVVSSTKYVSGGATCLGGLIIDYGNFDYSHSPRLAEMSKEFGKEAFTAKLRKEIHRNLGAYMTPQVAYMQTLGLETMDLRFDRAAGTCLDVARRLQSLPEVKKVNYTGLADNPFYELSNRQFGPMPGAMLTFDLSDRAACFHFLDHLKLIRRATNLFDNKTLALHPASTIFGTFTEELRQSMNISQNTIRLSVGLEPADDLMEDIEQALRAK
jgi:O-acetylhomoserine (thiol)-lyase